MATKARPLKDNKLIKLRKSNQDTTTKIQKQAKKKLLVKKLYKIPLPAEVEIDEIKDAKDLIVSYINNSYNLKYGNEKLFKIISLLQSTGPYTASSYFYAIERTKAVKELTSSDIIEFVTSIGPAATQCYFDAMINREAAKKLTSVEVLEFAIAIGREAAWRYFLTIVNTKAVEQLTRPKFLESAAPNGPSSSFSYFLALFELLRCDK